MKKLTRFAIICIAVIALPLTAQDPSPAKAQNKKNSPPGFAFLLRIAHMMPSESVFKEIYGNPQIYSIEFRLGKKKLGIWLEAGHQNSEGELTATGEITRLTITPIEAGLLFRFAKGRLVPYLGGGLGNYRGEESNALGHISINEIGYVGIGGISFHSGALMLDFKTKYNYCMFKPDITEENIEAIENNIGGLSFSLGLGLGF